MHHISKEKNSGSSTNINIDFRTKYKEGNCMMARGSIFQKKQITLDHLRCFYTE